VRVPITRSTHRHSAAAQAVASQELEEGNHHGKWIPAPTSYGNCLRLVPRHERRNNRKVARAPNAENTHNSHAADVSREKRHARAPTSPNVVLSRLVVASFALVVRSGAGAQTADMMSRRWHSKQPRFCLVSSFTVSITSRNTSTRDLVSGYRSQLPWPAQPP